MGIGEVGELLRRSTVHIRAHGRRKQSAGSGVVWVNSSSVVTNAHVVGEGSHSVELWDGRTVSAQLENRDDRRDLAKLKLAAIGALPVNFRDSPVKPGELVVAVGNPLGFSGALSIGIVHAVGPVAGLGGRDWVQAAIRLAPGNSGGPLADAAGRLVGINTMIAAGGIALAIPASVAGDFMRNGPSPRLGVSIQPVSSGKRGGIGLLVLSVESGSPAEFASILIGDILVGANETRFAGPADLSHSISEAGMGIFKLRFLRGGERERVVAVSLAHRPSREVA